MAEAPSPLGVLLRPLRRGLPLDRVRRYELGPLAVHDPGAVGKVDRSEALAKKQNLSQPRSRGSPSEADLNLGWINDPPVPSPNGRLVGFLIRSGTHNWSFGFVIAADTDVASLIRSPDVEATGHAGGSSADGAWQGVKLDHRISASLAWRSPYRRSAPLARTRRG